MTLDKSFLVQGNVADALSGSGSVTASAALHTSNPVNSNSWNNWSFEYEIANGMTESGQITITAHDGVGHPSTLIYTYTFDGAAPYTGSVQINNDAEYTNEPNAALDLYAADDGCGVAEMCLADAPACDSWESYQVQQNQTLSGGDGLKTIYVWYRDYLGNTVGPIQTPSSSIPRLPIIQPSPSPTARRVNKTTPMCKPSASPSNIKTPM